MLGDAPRSAALALVAFLSAGACSTQRIVTSIPSVANDAANRTLRRDLLAFGTSTLCSEIQKTSVPLRLRTDDPATGRFFIRQCSARELSSGDITLQWSGVGYGWSGLTHRIGFEARATVDYDPDFRADGGDLYLYFRPNVTQARGFNLRMTERVVSSPLGPLVPVGSPQEFANQLGAGLFSHELDRGFSVVRQDDGSTAFALGLIPPGERPAAPFVVEGSGKTVATNERVEIHQNQRDFAGPFEVQGDGDALYLTLGVEGAATVDFLVYPKVQGDVWLDGYTQTALAGPPPVPPVFDDVVSANLLYRHTLRVPRGLYYVVLDNTATAGRSAPSTFPGDDRAALVNLGVEVGAAP